VEVGVVSCAGAAGWGGVAGWVFVWAALKTGIRSVISTVAQNDLNRSSSHRFRW